MSAALTHPDWCARTDTCTDPVEQPYHQGAETVVTANTTGKLELWSGKWGALGVDALTIAIKSVDIDGHPYHIDVKIEDARALGEYLLAMANEHGRASLHLV